MNNKDLDLSQESVFREELVRLFDFEIQVESLEEQKDKYPDIFEKEESGERDFKFYLEEVLENSDQTEFDQGDLNYLNNFEFKEQSLEITDSKINSSINEELWLEITRKENFINKSQDHNLSKFLQEHFAQVQESNLEKNLLIRLDKQKQQFTVNFNLKDLKDLTINYQPETKNLSAKLSASKKINQIIQKKLSRFKDRLSAKYEMEILDFELEDLEDF